MDPFKNYFCDRPKWFLELIDLTEMYTLIRILWEHNAQNVVVDIPIFVANKNFTVRGNSGCKQDTNLTFLWQVDL